jgi:hypothetical protein
MAYYKRADVRTESRDLSGALADCREAERLATTLVGKTRADPDALRLQWATHSLCEYFRPRKEPQGVTGG